MFQFGQKKKAKEADAGVGKNSRGDYARRALWALAFVVLVAFVAFWGRPPHTPVVFKGMQLTFRFDAPFDFSYESEVLKRAREEEALFGVVPVYRADMENTDRSLQLYADVSEKISEDFDALRKIPERASRQNAILKIFNAAGVREIGGDSERLAMDISRLIDDCETAERFRQISDESMRLFRETAERGIVENVNRYTRDGITTEEFLRDFSKKLDVLFWRLGIASSGKISEMRSAVIDLFSPLIKPNQIFDAEATRREKDAAVAAVKPVVVSVREGEPLLLQGDRVSDEILEKWNAYRSAQSLHEERHFGISISFLTNLLYVFCVVVIAVFYSFLMIPVKGRATRRRLLFSGVMSVLNILLIRCILELTESDSVTQVFGSLGESLVWLSSPAVVAISVSAIAGVSLGILSSLFVGVIAALMLGGNIQILMMISVSSLIAVWVARNAMKRATLVRAGFYSGLAMAVTALCIGWYAETPLVKILLNTFSAISIGLFYGIISAGLLGILEGVFKARTNITFIELSDHNHPLLRKLQLVAPGTFHHCVMVANYAEQAAHAVGANTAVCRCASLYHDIGKTQKPEYFTENQGRDANPHDELTPQMSAIILKSHVRDGSELAVEYHLPERVRDIIEQHHGTSLVGYFFQKAKELATTNENGSAVGTVDESKFRYDGPKPQTIEAAIVMMSDVVEAASRSLKKITPQAVEELVAKLIRARVQDGEFDECPITHAQISTISRSLVNSVIQTFHSRIEYPKDATEPADVPADKRAKVRIVRKEI